MDASVLRKTTRIPSKATPPNRRVFYMIRLTRVAGKGAAGELISLAAGSPDYIRLILTYRLISGALTTTKNNAANPIATRAIRPISFLQSALPKYAPK